MKVFGDVVFHKNGWVRIGNRKPVRGGEARKQLALYRKRYRDKKRRDFIKSLSK